MELREYVRHVVAYHFRAEHVPTGDRAVGEAGDQAETSRSRSVSSSKCVAVDCRVVEVFVRRSSVQVVFAYWVSRSRDRLLVPAGSDSIARMAP